MCGRSTKATERNLWSVWQRFCQTVIGPWKVRKSLTQVVFSPQLWLLNWPNNSAGQLNIFHRQEAGLAQGGLCSFHWKARDTFALCVTSGDLWRLGQVQNCEKWCVSVTLPFTFRASPAWNTLTPCCSPPSWDLMGPDFQFSGSSQSKHSHFNFHYDQNGEKFMHTACLTRVL